RADSLQALVRDPRRIIVSSAEAVFEKVPERNRLEEESVRLRVGDTWRPQDLVDHLIRHEFDPVEFIEEPGQLALRGGILDVYPFAGDFPYRLEFFGDEVDSIREIDIHTQRSISRIQECYLVPNLERPGAGSGAYTPLFDFLPRDAILVTFDEQRLTERLEELREEAVEAHAAAIDAQASGDGAAENESADQQLYPVDRDAVEQLFLDPSTFVAVRSRFRTVRFGSMVGERSGPEISIGGRPQPSFNSSIKTLQGQLRKLADQDIKTIVLCDSSGQYGRLQELLEKEIATLPVDLRVDSLHEGFELPDARIALYTDHQIFDRYHRPSTRRRAKRKGGISLRELRNLNPGDFVVHVDYGIGRFAGLKKIRVRDRYQESVRLEYRDDDVLYVNISALHKLHRYTGKEGHQPRLTKLGSGQWEKTKSRTKKRVKDIARDLIKIYARRLATPGYAYPEDTLWQREMEASFQYEDTPDQASAADAVKDDMQKPTPMDRLVCGDVGFGKTEIAVRAA
ncbi:MAG: CarD family transcriptional regulator, partial [Rhodothermales bacterium]|nr:CarD family transcriptional regulator [Rhodothermales bacterium]